MSLEALGFVRAMFRRDDCTLTTTQRFVLMILAEIHNPHTRVAPFPSVKTLAIEVGIRERQVRRVLADLEDARIVYRRVRLRENASQSSNSYEFYGLDLPSVTPPNEDEVGPPVPRGVGRPVPTPSGVDDRGGRAPSTGEGRASTPPPVTRGGGTRIFNPDLEPTALSMSSSDPGEQRARANDDDDGGNEKRLDEIADAYEERIGAPPSWTPAQRAEIAAADPSDDDVAETLLRVAKRRARAPAAYFLTVLRDVASRPERPPPLVDGARAPCPECGSRARHVTGCSLEPRPAHAGAPT